MKREPERLAERGFDVLVIGAGVYGAWAAWDAALRGLTVAVILLPQAIAFAIIAELPPQMGLYAAVIGGLAGALWGSSNQIHNGPTNAISLLVLSTLSSPAVPGTPEYILAAATLALMVGVFQLLLGLARLGVLVNFVSHSVIVGFASGAGVLILIKQIAPLLGLTLTAHNTYETALEVILHFRGIGDFGIIQHLAQHVNDVNPNVIRRDVIVQRIQLGIRSFRLEILLFDVVVGQLGDVVQVHLHLLPLECLLPVVLQEKDKRRKDEKDRREIHK